MPWIMAWDISIYARSNPCCIYCNHHTEPCTQVSALWTCTLSYRTVAMSAVINYSHIRMQNPGSLTRHKIPGIRVVTLNKDTPPPQFKDFPLGGLPTIGSRWYKYITLSLSTNTTPLQRPLVAGTRGSCYWGDQSPMYWKSPVFSSMFEVQRCIFSETSIITLVTFFLQHFTEKDRMQVGPAVALSHPLSWEKKICRSPAASSQNNTSSVTKIPSEMKKWDFVEKMTPREGCVEDANPRTKTSPTNAFISSTKDYFKNKQVKWHSQ